MSSQAEHIALVGLAAKLPGAAGAAQFWRNLVDGVDAVRFLSDDELLASGVAAALVADSSYVRAVAEPDDLELFDAGFFNFTPRDAAMLDPQIRMFLEVAHSAVEDAGYDPHRVGDGMGVFGAVGTNRYLNLHVRPATGYEPASPGAWTLNTLSEPDYAATHLSYRFGFLGPSMTVSTACSSSAVAVHLACQALRTGECDLAIAAGAEAEMPPHCGYQWFPGGPLAPDGRCRPFDRRAAGTLFGTGAGAVVLKRLDEAIADGDHIRAVIRASAMTNDGGDKAGFTAPAVLGQVRAIREAMLLADVDATAVSFVEAHATGTPLGDPIEVAALTRAYRSLGADRMTRSLPLGSVKGNIGHLGHAAGIASLVKLALCLENRTLVPTANFTEPNPRMSLHQTPFTIGSCAEPWRTDDGRPRIAGLSSFGFGGTNVHLVVEEGPVPRRTASAARPRIVVCSAQSTEAARAYQERLGAHLAQLSPDRFADTVGVLQEGRTPYPVRAAVVAGDAREAAEALVAAPLGTAADARPVAFLFPGQAAQHKAMAAGLYGADRTFTETLHACIDEFASHEVRLGDRWRNADDATLAQTAIAQPLLFSVEFALAAMWQSWGVRPAAVLGHSIGELTAAAVSGVLDLPDAVRLVSARAAAMAAMPPGGMLAVHASVDQIGDRLPEGVDVAVVNGPRELVIAGAPRPLAETATTLRANGFSVRALPVRHAFHTPHMAPAAKRFDIAAAGARLEQPTLRMISAAAGGPITTEALASTFWSAQLVEPVRFDLAVDVLLGERGWTLLEVGPGQTLTRLIRAHRLVRDGTSVAVPTLPARPGGDDHRSVLAAAAALWTEGHDLNWAAVRQHEQVRRLPLPGYPYQRDRHWLPLRTEEASADSTSSPVEVEASGRQVALPFATTTWVERSRMVSSTSCVGEVALAILPTDPGTSLTVLTALQRAGYRVVVARPGEAFAEVGGELRIAPDRPADLDAVFQALSRREMSPALLVHATALTPFERPTTATVRDQVAATFHALAALAQRGSVNAPDAGLLVLASRSVDITGGEQVDPAKAALHGLVRSLAKENPDLPCRLIDVGAHTREDDLVAEVNAADSDPVVALRGSSRWVRAERDFSPPRGDRPAVRRGGVYLLTGGLGGLGLTVAEALARTGMRPRLVLLGRDAKAAEQPATRAAIARLEAAGAVVTVQAGDVGDRRTMRRVFDTLQARHGQVHGVLHLAGVAGGGMLLVRDRAAADAVLWPKVTGTVVLAETLSEQPPVDFFVTFSSRAAVEGLAGGADYAAANAFADAHTHLMAREGVPALTVNWPAWHTVGMAARPAPAARGALRWTSVLREDHPIVDEHRVKSMAVLPGTGHLDLVVRAFREVTGSPKEPVRLTDVMFQRALTVVRARRVDLTFQPDGTQWRFTVSSTVERGVGHHTDHVTGRVAVLTEPAPHLAAVADLRARLTHQLTDDDGPRMFTLGPRWRAVHRLTTDPHAPHEKLLELRLPEQYRGDLSRHPLHPSLLDCATAAIRDPRADGICIPFGYQSLRLYADLPAEMVSHTRRRPDSPGLLVADIDLYDSSGALVARIEGFTMRKVGEDFAADLENSGSAEALGTHGLDPEQGGRLLLSLLGSSCPVQVSVQPHVDGVASRTTSIVGEPRLSRAERPAATRPTAPRPTPSIALAPVRAGRPGTGPEVRNRLAKLWHHILGVHPADGEADFFELGGNSLSAAELMSAIGTEFGTRISIVALFDHPSLDALAELVAAQNNETPT
jgi:phthiocerol/phenolphthiocerol synthesis type-I polyketide synthase E